MPLLEGTGQELERYLHNNPECRYRLVPLSESLGCFILICFGLLIGFAHLVDDTEDIESGFHPDFHIAQQGARQHPNDDGYRLQYAFALYDKKQYVEAMEQLSPMLKTDKPHPDNDAQAAAFLYAGKIMIATGQREQAKKYLTSLIAVHPPHYEPGVTFYSYGNAAQNELNSIQ